MVGAATKMAPTMNGARDEPKAVATWTNLLLVLE
jgi:hypothetical protein